MVAILLTSSSIYDAIEPHQAGIFARTSFVSFLSIQHFPSLGVYLVQGDSSTHLEIQ